jgi:hypothetical protein
MRLVLSFAETLHFLLWGTQRETYECSLREQTQGRDGVTVEVYKQACAVNSRPLILRELLVLLTTSRDREGTRRSQLRGSLSHRDRSKICLYHAQRAVCFLLLLLIGTSSRIPLPGEVKSQASRRVTSSLSEPSSALRVGGGEGGGVREGDSHMHPPALLSPVRDPPHLGAPFPLPTSGGDIRSYHPRHFVVVYAYFLMDGLSVERFSILGRDALLGALLPPQESLVLPWAKEEMHLSRLGEITGMGNSIVKLLTARIMSVRGSCEAVRGSSTASASQKLRCMMEEGIFLNALHVPSISYPVLLGGDFKLNSQRFAALAESSVVCVHLASHDKHNVDIIIELPDYPPSTPVLRRERKEGHPPPPPPPPPPPSTTLLLHQ